MSFNPWKQYRTFATRTIVTAICSTIVILSEPIGLAQTPQDFGYGSIPHAKGRRPLVTILLQYSDARFRPEHTPAFYKQVLFGSESRRVPNLAGVGGYFHQNSYGQFQFEDVGVLGPFTNPDDPATPPNESLVEAAWGFTPGSSGTNETMPEYAETKRLKVLGNAIALADRAGFDFGRFDKNRDGTITNDELIVLVVLADSIRGDNLASTDKKWAGNPGDRRPDTHYRFVRVHGYVDGPDKPPARDKIPLYSWYSPFRGDNFITTDPRWAGQGGDKRAPDYGFVRLEGYVYPPEHSYSFGMVPLYSWYSRSRGDNFMTSDPAWAGKSGDRRLPDYEFVRMEGYATSPAFAQTGQLPLYSWYGGRSDGGGANRSTEPACVAVRSGRVCAGIPHGGESVDVATLAHELSHAIGYSFEHYGATGLNARYSLMASTSPRLLDGRTIAHHDPFVKMKLGWLTPACSTVTEKKEVTLRAAELPWREGAIQAWIVYDPQRGANEFFILEYRSNFEGRAATIPLYSWFSLSRGDNFVTTDSAWAGNIGDIRSPDYRFLGVEGYADPPNANGLGSKILNSWYSPSRGDNFITTHAAWQGTVGGVREPDYRFVRTEGILSPTPAAGMVALYSWFSPSRRDHFITSDPAWGGTAGETRAPDYRFVRVEGFASLRPPVNYDRDPWGSGHMGIPDSGLAIWHVKLDNAKNPERRQALFPANPNQTEFAVYMVPPGGSLGRPGDNGLWDAADGDVRLTWLDGTDSGIRIRVLTEVTSPILRIRIGS